MVLSHFKTRWKEEYLKDLREHHKVSEVMDRYKSNS